MRETRRLLPDESIVYLADQAHVPYGPRPIEQVRAFSLGIARALLEHGAKMIVVACNTASAAALDYLRGRFTGTPIVGMEPAVKPAVLSTRSGKVGVLATPVTFEGELYASLVERFAAGVQLHTAPLSGLVECIEAGQWTGEPVRSILAEAVAPMLESGVDTLVLACTHYPFIIPELNRLVGPEVEIIDPAPAIARQVRRVLDASDLNARRHSAGGNTFLTSGDPVRFGGIVQRVFGDGESPHKLTWMDGELLAIP